VFVYQFKLKTFSSLSENNMYIKRNRLLHDTSLCFRLSVGYRALLGTGNRSMI